MNYTSEVQNIIKQINSISKDIKTIKNLEAEENANKELVHKAGIVGLKSSLFLLWLDLAKWVDNGRIIEEENE